MKAKTGNRVFLSKSEENAYNLGLADSTRVLNNWIEAIKMTNGAPAKIYALERVREQIARLWIEELKDEVVHSGQ